MGIIELPMARASLTDSPKALPLKDCHGLRPENFVATDNFTKFILEFGSQ